MKISYILPDFDENANSGGLYVIFEHCNGLIKRGHRVRVFNNTGKKSKYLRLDCEVEKHHQDPSIIESGAPDIIVATHWRTYFFLERLRDVVKNNTKLFFLIQSDDRFLVNPEEKALVDKALTGLYRGSVLIYKIAVSKYLQDVLRCDYGQDSFYIRNGFEPRKVIPLLYRSDRVRIAARYDTSQYRGWDVINKVLSRISAERDDIEIHLFEMKDKLALPYKTIFHKGLTGTRLLSLFKSCDIYISGSSYEGFAYPVLEAMSQGSVVCCTDAGGNKDFCIDGETALLSGKGDAEAMYKNVIRLLDDKALRDKLKLSGMDKAKEFKWSESVSELEKAYSSKVQEKYDIRNTELFAEEKPAVNIPKAVLFVCWKDPLVNYSDWLKTDEIMNYFQSNKCPVKAVFLADRHNARAVRGRLDMLVEPSRRGSFKFLSTYHKKIKIRFGLLNKALFSCWVVIKLLGALLSSKGREIVVVEEAGENNLMALCDALKVGYRRLKFNEDILKNYCFGDYAKDHASKELEFRRIIRRALKTT